LISACGRYFNVILGLRSIIKIKPSWGVVVQDQLAVTNAMKLLTTSIFHAGITSVRDALKKDFEMLQYAAKESYVRNVVEK
jgi:predicted small secreted protein